MTKIVTVPRPKLTADRLRELLEYDPETGLWRWLQRVNPRCKTGWFAGTLMSPKGSNTSYFLIGVDRRHYLAHRLAFLYMTGEWPSGELDHRDLDGTNNRWANLREATRAQNAANMALRNSAGLKGIIRRKDRWQARI